MSSKTVLDFFIEVIPGSNMFVTTNFHWKMRFLLSMEKLCMRFSWRKDAKIITRIVSMEIVWRQCGDRYLTYVCRENMVNQITNNLRINFAIKSL